MRIRIFDKNLTFLSEIDNFESLSFQRKLKEAGNFILKINYTSENFELFDINNIIMLDNNTEKVGIIKEVSYSQNRSEEILTIRGWELKGIIKQRITIPTTLQATQSFSEIETETVLKDVIKQNCIDNFPFINLVIDTDQARGTKINFSTRYRELEGEMIKIAVQDDYGWKMYLDLANKKYNFEIIVGEDRTGSSSNPVIFADKYNNIRNQRYVNSKMNVVNYARVGGQGLGADRTIVNVDEGETGLNLYVKFVDARDIDDVDELNGRGQEIILKNSSLQTFDAEVIVDKPFKYEVDYDLGDFVTIQNKKLALKLDRQITAINEYYESENNVIEVVFGEDIKGVIDYVNGKTDFAID